MKRIPVTKPLIPPLEEFIPYLEKIWDSEQLTNGGEFHRTLEKRLADYLGVEYLSLFANGTLALVTALQALRVTGEVITTPYSFVATSHALVWNKLKPVFVDIEPDSCNLDPSKIEAAITSETTAIMPVHCYGVPCNVEEIQRVADIYGLKVIYDAAHAFGVRYDGESILKWGDLSILSFHATKVFNTFEGGALVCPDAKSKQRIDYLKNFGFADEVTVVAPGINGKMNEVQAAFGLLQLDYIRGAIDSRRSIYEKYQRLIGGIQGLSLVKIPENIEWNYSYCPVLVSDGFPLSRDDLYNEFRAHDVLVRRYFYPLISEFPMYRELREVSLNNAMKTSRSILCLPLFPHMTSSQFDEIESILLKASNL